MGKLAKIANMRLAKGDLKAKLCEISWMARKRFWFAVAPMTYAIRNVCHDKNGVLRRAYAQKNCRLTTPTTTGTVKISGPQSLRTCEAA
jgi:hypothetical protein